MRRLTPIFCLLLVAFVGCAPAPSSHVSDNATEFTDLPGTTGGFQDNSTVDYVANGDSRVETALQKPDDQASQPAKPPLKMEIKHQQKPTPNAPRTQTQTQAQSNTHLFRWRLREFEISRFAKGTNDPSRFGDNRYEIKVFFKDQTPVVFKGNFQSSGAGLFVDSTTGRYRFYGSLIDSKDDSKGDFRMYDSQTQQTAHIFLHAFAVRATVHEDVTAPVQSGSEFDKILQTLRGTFKWDYNWVVVRGVSFFMYDIVQQTIQGEHSKIPATNYVPFLQFKGKSLRTGTQTYPTTNLTPQSPVQFELVGNGDEEPSRMFSVTYTDPKTKKTQSVMVDFQDVNLPNYEQPAAQPTTEPQPTPQPTPEPQPEPQPTPQPPEAPAQPTGRSFLKSDVTQPRTAKMTQDLARNRDVPGVQMWIKRFKEEHSSWHSAIQRFFWNANPFRPIINAISESFDVSPVFADHTFVESSYFTGGHYRIEHAGSTSALGPFQFVRGTAEHFNLIGSRGDDRVYFAPSACASARYIGSLADEFKSRDSTIAILAYFQGKGGAAAAIYCTYSSHAGNRRACASRINNGMTEREYGRDLRLVNDFDYNYAELDRMAAIPSIMRRYVREVLAVYFISRDFEGNGFSLDGARESLPSKTVFPKHSIQDPDCRSALQSLNAGV